MNRESKIKMVVILFILAMMHIVLVGRMKTDASANINTSTQAISVDEKGLMWDTSSMPEFIQSNNKVVFPELSSIISDAIRTASEKYDIPAMYILLLIDIESAYKFDSVSSTGDVGLMQINLATWVRNPANKKNLVRMGIIKKESDLYDPMKNIDAGTFIFKDYLAEGFSARAKDKNINPIEFALKKYNGSRYSEHYAKLCQKIGPYTIHYGLSKMEKGV
jgi:hypothetical protein